MKVESVKFRIRLKLGELVGKTPIIRHKMSWKKLSVIGAISKKDFQFQIVSGAVKSCNLIHFLKMLLKENQGKILLI